MAKMLAYYLGASSGRTIGFGELVELAKKEMGFTAFIDPDDLLFYEPGDNKKIL
jgi:hypothetical protein